jgi:hypothetical protein
MQYELIIAEIAVCQILLDKRIKFHGNQGTGQTRQIECIRA